MSNLWKTLETLKNHQWIELSHELSNEKSLLARGCLKVF